MKSRTERYLCHTGGRWLLLAAVLAILASVACGCGGADASDPFRSVRGDFDAEITWQAGTDTDGTVFGAGVTVRKGRMTLEFTQPEHMRGVTVRETEEGVEIRRGDAVLRATAYSRYLMVARLLTDTGRLIDRTDGKDGVSFSYLVTLPDGSQRTRSASLDGAMHPLTVTDPALGTVRVVWFEERP